MTYKIYGLDFNRGLISSAKQSERLRYHQNLHHSYDEPVQKIAIALVKGTYIPPHYHELSHQWEFFNIICGNVSMIIFNKEGYVEDRISLFHNSDDIYSVQIEPGTIHTLLCESNDAVIFEMKQGPFVPEQAKIIPAWAPDEKYHVHSRETIVDILKNIIVGDSFPELLAARIY